LTFPRKTKISCCGNFAGGATNGRIRPIRATMFDRCCPEPDELGNAQARMLRASAQSYLDVRARPSLHLVDGGLADNLGVKGIIDRARRWSQELMALRGQENSPFAADARLHIISVSLRDLHDEELKKELLQVPTAFSILPTQARLLQRAGRAALRDSLEFQALRADLQGAAMPAEATRP
jgi:hypothetical protein